MVYCSNCHRTQHKEVFWLVGHGIYTANSHIFLKQYPSAMAKFTIYHNPRCSKSRQTLALLEAHAATAPDTEINIIEYLKTPPSSSDLQALLTLLACAPRDLMRTKEAVYEELELAQVNDAELVAAMVEHPILIERPIVRRDNQAGDGQAIIGRPPENVEQLF